MSRKDQLAHKLVEPSKLAKTSGLGEFAKKVGRDPLTIAEEKFIALPKHDGCYCVIHYKRGAEYRVHSRTGEEVVAFEYTRSFLDALGAPDGVYIGEAWHPNLPFPEIAGTFKRKYIAEDKDLLHFVVHDFVTHEEWAEGRSYVGFAERVSRLGKVLDVPTTMRAAPLYPVIGFGINPWPRIKHDAQSLANELVKAGGYDGLVLADPDGLWFLGDNGKNGEKLKIKPNVELSLRLIYINEAIGEKTGRAVYTYLLENKAGKQFTVGSGVPHKPEKLAHVGDVIEVVAMGWTDDGELREPRVKGVRTDVKEID